MKTFKLLTVFLILISNAVLAQETYEILYPNGSVKVKGTLVEGQKHGLWEAYDTNNNLIIQREYKNNVMVKNYLQNTPTKKTELKQEDVIWSKRIERILPSTFSKNKPLYDQENLRLILLKLIKNEQIVSYESMKLDSVLVQSIALQQVAKMDITKSSFKLKEDWYFNKKTNTMEVAIVALSIGTENGKDEISFYFPQFVSNIRNEKLIINESKLSLNDYFSSRLFESRITRESNITERGMTKERATEINKILLDTEIKYWFKK